MTTTLAMMTGRCDCGPCKSGEDECSRSDPCEACQATMRLVERWKAAREPEGGQS